MKPVPRGDDAIAPEDQQRYRLNPAERNPTNLPKAARAYAMDMKPRRAGSGNKLNRVPAVALPVDDPTYTAKYQRITEGLRKAGVPEGEKKTN